MGTVGEEIGCGHPGQEGVDLPWRQPVSGPDRRLAGHIGQDILQPAGPGGFTAVAAETLQDVEKEPAWLA